MTNESGSKRPRKRDQEPGSDVDEAGEATSPIGDDLEGATPEVTDPATPEDEIVDGELDFDLPEEFSIDPEKELLKGERDEYLKLLQQLQADFDNYRRRANKQIEEAKDRAGEELVRLLLPAFDTLALALSHVKDEEGEDAKALSQVSQALFGALQTQGLAEIDPTGEPFDPNVADAVLHEPGEGGEPTVTEVLRLGYRWKDKVIRAAMVKVSG